MELIVVVDPDQIREMELIAVDLDQIHQGEVEAREVVTAVEMTLVLKVGPGDENFPIVNLTTT